MVSIAKSAPPRKRKIPKTRYQFTNEALRSGARLSNRCDPHIFAARWGEVAMNVPRAIATELTNRFVAIESNHSPAHFGAASALVLRNVGAIPPSAPKSLKESGGIRIAIGLGLNEIDHRLLVSLLSI